MYRDKFLLSHFMKNTIRNFPACIIILVIFLFNYIPAFSFPYNIDKKGIEMGLSDNNIMCIEQDNKGFVWVGKEWGINCFNGYEFLSYKAE